MDVRRVLLLREVAHHGSISAAARTVGITQPALSQHIRELESEVGTPLLIRESTGIRLTEAGHALLHHADAIAAHLSAADDEIGALTSLETGRLRIVAFPSAIAGLLPPLLAAMHRRIPRLDLHLTEAEPPEAVSPLQSDQADVAIVFRYHEDPSWEDSTEFQWIPWCTDSIRLVVPRDPQARVQLGIPRELSEITMESCRNASWIAGCTRCQNHLVDVARAHGFHPTIWHQTDDTLTNQVLVAGGHGVTLMNETALHNWTHPGIVALPLSGLGVRSIGALVRPAVTTVPAVSAFLQELSHVCAQPSGAPEPR